MIHTNLIFSFFLIIQSAAALAPAPDDPHRDHPSSLQHNAERDLLLPEHLNNATSRPPTPSPLNTTNAIRLICYRADPHSPIILPENCHTALYTLLVAPNALIPQHWDYRSNLPFESAYLSCSIIMGRASARSDDIFPVVLFAHAAALVMQSCVTARHGFQGGMTRIGAGGGFAVYVSASGAANGASATA